MINIQVKGRAVAPLLWTLNSAKVEQSHFQRIMDLRNTEENMLKICRRKLRSKINLSSRILTRLILHSEKKRQNSDLPKWKISVIILN